MARTRALAPLAALLFVLLPAAAPGAFHLVKIIEVFPGTASEPTAQYIVLQAYAPGQNLVRNQSVSVFDATGMMRGTFTFTGDVANGADLATILVATPDAEALFGITADLTMTPVIEARGGAVCWESFDCVAWGSFGVPNSLPAPPGYPFNAASGLPLGSAMHRGLSSGGSVTGFALLPPAPRNNAGQTGTLGAPTPTPTATPQPGSSGCIGDCNGDEEVRVDEILRMVDIALGRRSVAIECEAGDPDRDGHITVDEILRGVQNALNGCPTPRPTPTGTPTQRSTPTPTRTAFVLPPPYY